MVYADPVASRAPCRSASPARTTSPRRGPRNERGSRHGLPAASTRVGQPRRADHGGRRSGESLGGREAIPRARPTPARHLPPASGSPPGLRHSERPARRLGHLHDADPCASRCPRPPTGRKGPCPGLAGVPRQGSVARRGGRPRDPRGPRPPPHSCGRSPGRGDFHPSVAERVDERLHPRHAGSGQGRRLFHRALLRSAGHSVAVQGLVPPEELFVPSSPRRAPCLPADPVHPSPTIPSSYVPMASRRRTRAVRRDGRHGPARSPELEAAGRKREAEGRGHVVWSRGRRRGEQRVPALHPRAPTSPTRSVQPQPNTEDHHADARHPPVAPHQL